MVVFVYSQNSLPLSETSVQFWGVATPFEKQTSISDIWYLSFYNKFANM